MGVRSGSRGVSSACRMILSYAPHSQWSHLGSSLIDRSSVSNFLAIRPYSLTSPWAVIVLRSTVVDSPLSTLSVTGREFLAG